MATIGDIVSDQEQQNWRKALRALETTKDGLQHFVEQELKNVHTRILQDVRSDLNLPASTSCTSCCTANLLKCPTPGVCKKRGKTSCRSMHDSPAKQPRPCPMKFCEIIRDSIAKEHRYGRPSWQNTRAELWASDSWEIAKCFMPPDGYMGVGCSQNTDLDGIINVMLNCKHFDNKLSFAIASQQPNSPCLLTKTRDIIRSVCRSSQFEVTDIDLQDYSTTVIDLLSDSKFLAHDGSAQEAVRKLRDIKHETMKTIVVKINHLLIAVSETCRNNNKESEESMKLTLAYMADCQKKLDELIAEMSVKIAEHSKKSVENNKKIDEHSKKIDEKSKNIDERYMKIAERARLIEHPENERKIANNPKTMDIIHKQASEERLLELVELKGMLNGICYNINDILRTLIQDVHPTLEPHSQEAGTKYRNEMKPVKDTMSLNEHHGAISKPSQQWKVDPSISPEAPEDEKDETNLEGVFDLKKSAFESSDVPAEECPVKDTANPFEYPLNLVKQSVADRLQTRPPVKQKPDPAVVIYDRKESASHPQQSFAESDSVVETTTTHMRQKFEIGMKSVERPYLKMKCEINRFLILKSSCETIKGILTICKQDFPNASPLIDVHLKDVVSANSVQIYTTEEFQQHFEDGSNETAQNISAKDVAELIKQTKEFALIVINSSQQASVSEALGISEIRNAGVLIVGKTQELPVMSNVFFRHTNTHTATEADCLLERCSMTILKTIYLNLKRYDSHNSVDSTTEREKHKLQNMYGLIKACFKRSTIPSTEWPDFPPENVEYPPNIDKAVEAILKKPAIIGCVKKRGILQIYIEASAAEIDMEEDIQSELKNYDVTKYEFLRRTTKKLFSSGDSVFDVQGTLGGFVKKESLPIVPVNDSAHEETAGVGSGSSTLVALVSRHVAEGLEYLTVGRNRIRIGRIGLMNADEAIDILPVEVFDECRVHCDTHFKAEFGPRMTVAKLRKTDAIQDLVGSHVHIWSEKSAPGLGILVQHDLIHENGIRIIVRDRDDGAPFAHDGDSGAMVCCCDPRRGGTLYAVAMVVETMSPEGDDNSKEYTAQILDEALQKLSLRNDCQFLFIEDDH